MYKCSLSESLRRALGNVTGDHCRLDLTLFTITLGGTSSEDALKGSSPVEGNCEETALGKLCLGRKKDQGETLSLPMKVSPGLNDKGILMPPQRASLPPQQDQLKITFRNVWQEDISYQQCLDKETSRGNLSFGIQQGSNPDD
ncbi:hypothetical protein TURU_141192 [Turdus rufiventris]|nr:hypothetical protein TURU_141192 [Turdus rufiventris]